MFAPTFMMQKGTQGGPNDFTFNYQHNLLFVWQPVRDSNWGTGTLVVNGLEVFQLTGTTGVDFTRSLGINSPISDSVADSSSLKALYWWQDFPDGVGDLKVGHIELNSVVTTCSYLCDDTQSFISGALSTNLSSTAPGQGLGVQGGVSFGSGFGLELGVADGNGNGTLNTDGIKSDELFFAAALTATNPFPEVGNGSYRLAYYRVDPTKRASAAPQAASDGFAFHAEQEFGNMALAGRYAKADGRQGFASHNAALAAIWHAPFGLDTDQLGFGAASLQPSTAGTKREYVSELFYKTQLTPLTQFTIGAALFTRPNKTADTGNEVVFNTRFRAHF